MKNMQHLPIEYHADDYAMFPAQSRRILGCITGGKLNGVSVMPNHPCLADCMAQLRTIPGETAVSIHLNLLEGPSLCDPARIPLLTDGQGILRCSFGSLLLHSILPGRNAYRQQLKQELYAQICVVRSHMAADAPLRIDSHAHYHMIPVVFDALMDVIREEHLPVQYIRIPREHLALYLPHLGKLRDFSWLNLVKVGVLNILSALALRKYGEILKNMEQRLFLGVFLSGRMHRENLDILLPGAMNLAQELGVGMEVLSHPGGVFEPEDIAAITSAADRAFLTSDLRRRECAAFLTSEYVTQV